MQVLPFTTLMLSCSLFLNFLSCSWVLGSHKYNFFCYYSYLYKKLICFNIKNDAMDTLSMLHENKVLPTKCLGFYKCILIHLYLVGCGLGKQTAMFASYIFSNFNSTASHSRGSFPFTCGKSHFPTNSCCMLWSPSHFYSLWTLFSESSLTIREPRAMTQLANMQMESFLCWSSFTCTWELSKTGWERLIPVAA